MSSRARWCLYTSAAALLGLACSSSTPPQTADSAASNNAGNSPIPSPGPDARTSRPASDSSGTGAYAASADRDQQEHRAARPSLDAAHIIAITDAANTAEIEQGRLARVRAKDARVRDFAAMMVKHHAEARKDQRKLKVEPQPGADVLNMKRESQRKLTELREKKGKEFDRAYIDLQVDEHRALLGRIDRELLPAAKDDGVTAYLKQIKPRVESHLAQAERLQQELGATSQVDARDADQPRQQVSSSSGSSARLSKER